MSRGQEQIALWAAIEAGYFVRGEWEVWAERRIDEDNTVPSWLFDLSRASTVGEALSALAEGTTADDWNEGGPLGRLDFTSLQLGFLYLRHHRGEMDLAALLRAAGELADVKDYDQPSCEAFFLLLHEVEAGAGGLSGQVEALFRDHVAAASRWLVVLAGKNGAPHRGESMGSTGRGEGARE